MADVQRQRASPGFPLESTLAPYVAYAHALLGEQLTARLDAGLAAEEWPLAARLIQLIANDIFIVGEFRLVHRWLAALPFDFISGDSGLTVLSAWAAYLCGDIAYADDLIAALDDARLAAAPEVRGALLCLRAWFASQAEDGPTGDLARAALDLLPPDDLIRPMALFALGYSQWRGGDLGGALASSTVALRSSLALRSTAFAMAALSALGLSLSELGRRHEALARYDEVLADMIAPNGCPLPHVDLSSGAHALLYYEANDLARARDLAERAWVACQCLICQPILSEVAAMVRALAAAGIGDLPAALAALRQARSAASSLGWAGHNLAALEAQIQLRAGNLLAAEAWAAQAGLRHDNPLHLGGLPILVEARLLIAQGRLGAADTLLATLAWRAESEARLPRLITIRVLQARVAHQRGEASAALETLAEAVALAAPEGYLRRFLDEGPEVVALLRRIWDAGGRRKGFIEQILAAAQAPPGQPALCAAHPTPSF